jgi:hypothetical protein
MTANLHDDLRKVARDAQRRAGSLDFDTVLAQITAAARREAVFFSRVAESTLEFTATDFEKIYANYAAKLGKDKLNDDERRQAFMDHVLNNE